MLEIHLIQIFINYPLFLKKRCTGCCQSNDKKRVTFLNISIKTRLNF